MTPVESEIVQATISSSEAESLTSKSKSDVKILDKQSGSEKRVIQEAVKPAMFYEQVKQDAPTKFTINKQGTKVPEQSDSNRDMDDESFSSSVQQSSSHQIPSKASSKRQQLDEATEPN